MSAKYKGRGGRETFFFDVSGVSYPLNPTHLPYKKGVGGHELKSVM